MNSKVIVSGEESGAVVYTSEHNPDYGYFKVEQVRSIVDDNGFLSRKKVTALVPGLVEDLLAMNLVKGQSIEGKIIVEESLEPFNKKQPKRDLKVAGDTGIACTLGGMPIYRRTKFTFNESAVDTRIEHDNVDELRAAYNAEKTKSVITPNEDFSIEG